MTYIEWDINHIAQKELVVALSANCAFQNVGLKRQDAQREPANVPTRNAIASPRVSSRAAVSLPNIINSLLEELKRDNCEN
jgi:hypothetical protein